MVQREDDTEEAIRRRLELYERQTAPLIEWYLARNQLETVPGHGLARRRDPSDGQGHREPAGPQGRFGHVMHRSDETVRDPIGTSAR